MEVSNRYSIQREVASGGMARVFLATDSVLGREVAVKMLHRHLLENPHSLKRFETEAHVIAQLSHENVIKLFDYGVDTAGERFLVMEFVHGKTIEELIQTYKTFPNLVLLEIFVQVLSGLVVAHQKGIYHRDVKPSNIMIDESGCIKIMDFGIAYLVNQGSITLTGTFVGSPNYISPEQAEGRTISEKSDLFSAATMMYECATGRCPFVGENVHATLNAILSYDPAPAYQENPHLLSEISALIGHCLKKDPSQRPTPTALLASIDEYCRGLGLVLGKKRAIAYFADPKGYGLQEERELYDILCARARDSSRRRKTVNSLKYFSQASQFGELSPFDRKLIDRMKGSALAVRVAPIVVGVALLFFCGYWLLNVIQARFRASAIAAIAPAPDPGAAVRAKPAEQDTETRKSVAETGGGSARSRSPSPGRTGALLMNKTGGKEHSAGGVIDIPSGVEHAGARSGAEKTGYLRIRTNPPWSDLYLDGMFVGNFPKISLVATAPGTHQLTVKNSRCADTIASVEARPGDTTVLDLVLHPLTQKPLTQ